MHAHQLAPACPSACVQQHAWHDGNCIARGAPLLPACCSATWCLPALRFPAAQVTEGASIQDCEGVFAYLDSRTAAFKAPPFGEKCKLTLLRTCNMLLKRLSKVRVGGWAEHGRADI